MNFQPFSCNKCNSSPKSSFLFQKDNSMNNKENNNKEDLLLPSDDNNDTSDLLEIIDYPYSLNNNEDKTIEMDSNHKNIFNRSKINSVFNNNINAPSFLLEEKNNNNRNLFNNNFYNNSSNNSSGIINNEDSIIQNKMLLNNYYNNENNKNRNNNQVKKISNTLNSINLENKKNHYNIGIKVEFPSYDNEITFSKVNKNVFQCRLNKTIFPNKKIRTKKKNLNKDKAIKKNNTNFFSFKPIKNKKTINFSKTLETNKSYIDKEKYLKYNTKIIYDTYDLNVNRSTNNIKAIKLFRGKINKILFRKGINKNKLFQKNKTINKLNHSNLHKSLKSKCCLIHKTKKKPMYASDVNFISSLLKRMEKIKEDTIKTYLPQSKTKIKINQRNQEKPLIQKKNDKNPFTTIEKTNYKNYKNKAIIFNNSSIKI